MFLPAGEALTATLNSGAGFRLAGTVTGVQSSAQSYAGWQKIKWVWPFDQYPTFAYSWEVGIYRTGSHAWSMLTDRKRRLRRKLSLVHTRII
jgi:hypothetical protein